MMDDGWRSMDDILRVTDTVSWMLGAELACDDTDESAGYVDV